MLYIYYSIYIEEVSSINPSLRQLQVFHAVASERSYTRAAQNLYLSQPAVSIQVKQLEEIVGLPLFEKIGKKIQLTPAGEEMYACASTILQNLEDTGEIIDAMKGLSQGRLELAVATTASYFATRMSGGFLEQHPGVSISLDVTNRQSILNRLEENTCDLVIMGEPPKNKDLEAQAFMDNPLVVIAGPRHDFVHRDHVGIDELAEQRFVVRERGSGTRAAIERFFESHGQPFHTCMEMTSNEAIKQAVQADLGLGIVSRHTVELELETGRLFNIRAEGFPIMRHWYLVLRRGKRLSPVANRFREFVLAEAEHYVAGGKNQQVTEPESADHVDGDTQISA